MTIHDARLYNIEINHILATDMTDEEKAVYIFEKKQDQIKKVCPELFYAMLGMAEKYKVLQPGNYFSADPIIPCE